MSVIDVLYQDASMEKVVAEAIIDAIRAYASTSFNDRENLSFKFHEPHPFDELSDEIVIRLDVGWMRFDRTTDEHAGSLAQLIAENIGSQVFGTIGVVLRYQGRTGWGVADLFGERPEKVAGAQ